MTTLASYLSQRATAGSRYSAAVTELFSAMIDLAALDRTIENSKAAGPVPQKSFVGDLQDLPTLLAHPVFSPLVPRRFADEIKAQTNSYVSAIT